MFTKDELVLLRDDILIGRSCWECRVAPTEEKCADCACKTWTMLKRVEEELKEA